nr:ribosomal protein S3, mitochondrial [Tanacetum cinerariifolium]
MLPSLSNSLPVGDHLRRSLDFQGLGVDNTKNKRPQPRSNSTHDKVLSASKSSQSKNKEAEVEVHHRNLLLSRNNKHISSACNNIKTDSQDVIPKVVCAMCNKCLIFVNHDKCLRNHVNGKNSRGNIVDSSESKSQFDCSNVDNACISNSLEPKIKRFPNSTSLLDRALQMSGTDTTSSNARRPLEDTRDQSMSGKKHTGRACFDRVSGAQLNVDIMNARCRIPGRESRATTPLCANR